MRDYRRRRYAAAGSLMVIKARHCFHGFSGGLCAAAFAYRRFLTVPLAIPPERAERVTARRQASRHTYFDSR